MIKKQCVGKSKLAQSPQFRAMTGYYLITMQDPEDLRLELNVQSLEDRHTIWQEIQILKQKAKEEKSEYVQRSDMSTQNVSISLADELWNQFRELRERSSKEDSEIEARRLAQENRFRNGIFAVPSVFERVGGSASPRELLNRGTFSPGLTKSLEHARNSASAIFVESSAIAQRKREIQDYYKSWRKSSNITRKNIHFIFIVYQAQ